MHKLLLILTIVLSLSACGKTANEVIDCSVYQDEKGLVKGVHENTYIPEICREKLWVV